MKKTVTFTTIAILTAIIFSASSVPAYSAQKHKKKKTVKTSQEHTKKTIQKQNNKNNKINTHKKSTKESSFKSAKKLEFKKASLKRKLKAKNKHIKLKKIVKRNKKAVKKHVGPKIRKTHRITKRHKAKLKNLNNSLRALENRKHMRLVKRADHNLDPYGHSKDGRKEEYGNRGRKGKYTKPQPEPEEPPVIEDPEPEPEEPPVIEDPEPEPEPETPPDDPEPDPEDPGTDPEPTPDPIPEVPF